MATVKLTAILTDSDGNPLPNKTITFSYSYDGVNFTEFARINTDDKGYATATHTTDAPTVYIASFQGDVYYLPSSSMATYTLPPVSSQQETTVRYNYGLMFLILVIAMLLYSRESQTLD